MSLQSGGTAARRSSHWARSVSFVRSSSGGAFWMPCSSSVPAMPSSSRRLSRRRSASGRDARPAAVDREADHPAESPGVRRREQRCGPLGTRLVFQRELEAELGPFVRQAALELAELFD